MFLNRMSRVSVRTFGSKARKKSPRFAPPIEYPVEGEFLQPRKTFGRKQMRSEYLAKIMNESSLVLISNGQSLSFMEELRRRKEFKQLGFAMHRFKSSNLLAAAKYYNAYNHQHVNGATEFAHGHLVLLLYNNPLLSLANAKQLKSILAMFRTSEVSKSETDKRLQLMGAFLMDVEKDNPYVWMNLKELQSMLDKFVELSKHLQVDEEMLSGLQPHSVFQAELNRLLVGNMAGITKPLEQQLNELPQTLQTAIHNVGNVFGQVLAEKRKKE